MKLPSQPLPALHLSRAQWRCLRVVSEVRDIAHAARKLHWSQALLKSELADLHACVGAQHIALSDKQVQISPTLKHLIDERPGAKFAYAQPGAFGGLDRVKC